MFKVQYTWHDEHGFRDLIISFPNLEAAQASLPLFFLMKTERRHKPQANMWRVD